MSEELDPDIARTFSDISPRDILDILGHLGHLGLLGPQI